MQRMNRSRVWGIVVGGLVLGLGMGGRALANHDPDVTDGELKCQTTTSGIQGKFVAAVAKCAIKCRQGAAKGTNPVSDCVPPYGGTTATATCIGKAVTKAQTDQPAKCLECPACYTGGNCTADAAARTTNTQAQLVAFGALVYCDDSSSGDGLSAAELKCQGGVAGALSKFVGAIGKCSAKCKSGEHAGSITLGDCDPPGTNATLVACAGKATGSAAGAIDKACADKPECYVAVTTGAGWVALAQGALNAAYPMTYCGD